MINLSLAQCINATNNGVFRIQDLQLEDPLSIDDMEFIIEYLKITPVTGLDLSFILTKENSDGLRNIAELIDKNKHITYLKFEVLEFDYEFEYKNNPETMLFGFIDDHKIKSINNEVINALIAMLHNKPNLAQLNIDLNKINTPASKSQTYELANNISHAPLQSLDMKLAVEKGAHLPIIKSNTNNRNLKHVAMEHCEHGADVLNCLQNATGLESLTINDMLFSEDDLNKLVLIIRSNPSLKVLGLSKTNIGQLDSQFVFDNLKKCPNLRSLSLSESNLSRHNVDALCAYLSSDSCSIAELDLSKNAYTDVDVIKIAAALRSDTKLQKLNIGGVLAEDPGLKAVFQLLQINPGIKSISMARNCHLHPSDETIDHLCNLLIDSKCQITELSFDENMTSHQFKSLSRAILANKSLKKLSLNYQDFGIIGMLFEYKINQHLGMIVSSVSQELTDKFVDLAEEIFWSKKVQPEAAVHSSSLLFFPPEGKAEMSSNKEVGASLSVL